MFLRFFVLKTWRKHLGYNKSDFLKIALNFFILIYRGHYDYVKKKGFIKNRSNIFFARCFLNI